MHTRTPCSVWTTCESGCGGSGESMPVYLRKEDLREVRRVFPYLVDRCVCVDGCARARVHQ